MAKDKANLIILHDSGTSDVKISLNAWVLNLKTEIFRATKIKQDCQQLEYGGIRLEDFKFLTEYGIKSGDKIILSRTVKPQPRPFINTNCENCGEAGHDRRFCFERPRKVGAKYETVDGKPQPPSAQPRGAASAGLDCRSQVRGRFGLSQEEPPNAASVGRNYREDPAKYLLEEDSISYYVRSNRSLFPGKNADENFVPEMSKGKTKISSCDLWQREKGKSKLLICDTYFKTIQSRKKLSRSVQEALADKLAWIPLPSLQSERQGGVIEIYTDSTVADAVNTLSNCYTMFAPVVNVNSGGEDWSNRYLGIINFPAVIFWVLETADMAASALSTTSESASTDGILGVLAMGATGPAAVAAMKVAADGSNSFDQILLQEKPFKKTKVSSLVKSFRASPFLPVWTDSSMLTLLLLLVKYRMRNVPVLESGKGVKSFVTPSDVIDQLFRHRRAVWFDQISSHELLDLGLPFMSHDKVICVQGDDLVLEVMKRMKDNDIGGVPVVEVRIKKIVSDINVMDITHLLLKPEIFPKFRNLTVKEFVDTISKPPPITCRLRSTLGDVIRILSLQRAHRVYVVNRHREVTGVITVRDVISCFISEPRHHLDNFYGFCVQEFIDKCISSCADEGEDNEESDLQL